MKGDQLTLFGSNLDPQDEYLKDRARQEARRLWLERDPRTSELRVLETPVLERDIQQQPAAAPSGHDRRKQAYKILTDEPILTSRTGLLERLTNAATYAGLRVDFATGNVRGVEFVDISLESMQHPVVRRIYGIHLPRDFEEARKVYDAVIKKIR